MFTTSFRFLPRKHKTVHINRAHKTKILTWCPTCVTPIEVLQKQSLAGKIPRMIGKILEEFS